MDDILEEEEFLARGYSTLLVVSGFSEVPLGFEREARLKTPLGSVFHPFERAH